MNQNSQLMGIPRSESNYDQIALAFDAPLFYTRETGCLNTKKSSVFKLLEGANMQERKMVPPA